MQDSHKGRKIAVRSIGVWCCALVVIGVCGKPCAGQEDGVAATEIEVLNEVASLLTTVRGAGAAGMAEPAAVARPLARGLAMLNSLESHLQRLAEREKNYRHRDPAEIVGLTVRARLLRAELYVQAAEAVDAESKVRQVFEDRADAAYNSVGRVALNDRSRTAAVIGRLRVSIMTGGRTREVAEARDAARAAVLTLPSEQRDAWRDWLTLAMWRQRLAGGTAPAAGELRSLLRDATVSDVVRGRMVWLALAAGVVDDDEARVELLRHPLVASAAPALARLSMLQETFSGGGAVGAEAMTVSERATLTRQSLMAGRIDLAYAVQPGMTLADLFNDTQIEADLLMAMRIALLRRAVMARDHERITLLLSDVPELAGVDTDEQVESVAERLAELPAEMLWLIVRARVVGHRAVDRRFPSMEQVLVALSEADAPLEVRGAALRSVVGASMGDPEKVGQLLNDRSLAADDAWLLTADAIASWRTGGAQVTAEQREAIGDKVRTAQRSALDAGDSALLARLAVVSAVMEAKAPGGSMDKALQILSHDQRHIDAAADVNPVAEKLAVAWLLKLGRNEEAAARLATLEGSAIGLGRVLDVVEGLLDRPEQTAAVRDRVGDLLDDAVRDARLVGEADWVRLATLASRAGAHEMVMRVYRDAPPQLWDDEELAWAAAVAFAAAGDDKRASQIITRRIGYDDAEAMLGRVDEFVGVGSDQVSGWLVEACMDRVGVSSHLWPDLQLRLAEQQARRGELESAGRTLRRAALLWPTFENQTRRSRIDAVETMIDRDGKAPASSGLTDTPSGGQ